MRIWIGAGRCAHAYRNGVHGVGAFLRSNEETGAIPPAVPILMPAEMACPPGFERASLLDGLKPNATGFTSDGDIYLVVNGLGDNALRRLCEHLPAERTILTFDANGIGEIHYLEYLAWLSGHGMPFAVISESSHYLLTGAAAGAAAVITPNGPPELERLHTIAALRRPGSPRPMTYEEIDSLATGEAALGVNACLPAGSELTADHLVEISASIRGISPHLLDRVIGRCLRYAIEPGQPLTFGHLL